MDIEERLSGYGQVYLVYDKKVGEYADILAGKVDAIKGRLCIDGGERSKTVDTVADICAFLLALNADKDALLLGMGGGTVTDVTGMAASIYKRGIRAAFIPTTLLAMADAAHGGKNGVNLGKVKNAIGSFLLPEFVHIDTSFLKTLPKREFLCGEAEILKTFIIADPNLYHRAVKYFSSQNTDLEELGFLLDKCIGIKNDIVRKDPLDLGERHVLNLGHTFAHAMEWYESSHKISGKMSHGEAVAAGIICAARLSEQRGIARKGLTDNLISDFAACGLPTESPCSPEDLIPGMTNDKKNSDGCINYILLKDIGCVIWSA